MRLEGHTLSRFVVSSALVLILATAGSARASSVTVTGGFTGFSGLASGTFTTTPPGGPGQCDPFFRAFVAGSLVNAPICTSRTAGPATYEFPSMMSSFEFYEVQFIAGVPNELAHNGFSFTSAGAQVPNAINGNYLLGTLTFTNGTWFGTGPVNSFHIVLTTSSSDSTLDNHTLSADLILDIRVGNTPVDNGDCFSFFQFQLGQVCAFEPGVPGQTNTVSVDLFGRIGSLIPTEFANVTGGFLLPPTTTAVPEPVSLILVGTGFAAGLRRRRRTR